jgi:hypothetical protein
LKLQAQEYRETLRINAANGISSLDYYKAVESFYSEIIDPKLKQMPQKPQGPTVDLKSQEAKMILGRMMSNLKRSQGYSPKRINNNGSG